MNSCNGSDCVDIILPVYNAERFISEAIESILNQTYQNIKLYIIDDGSIDKTRNIIETKFKSDKRIHFISRENKGLIYTLNELISFSTSPYIARMDADDICAPDRIEKQVNYLLNNPDVSVLGSEVIIIRENGTRIRKNLTYKSFDSIKLGLLYGNPISHPTVMFNMRNLSHKDIHYSEKYHFIEDFELWLRLSREHIIENIGCELLQYRETQEGISRTKRDIQIIKARELLSIHFNHIAFSEIHISSKISIAWVLQSIKILKNFGFSYINIQVVLLEFFKVVVRSFK